MERIKRDTLRDRVRESLRERIVLGELSPGQALAEHTLSASLGVSRTPLREALLQLEREGMVRAAPAKGFAVAPLTVGEVEELFPIVGSLHGLALRLAGAPTGEQLELLRTLNAAIGTGSDPGEVFSQDLNWHRLLLVRCANSRLLDLIDALYDATRRYDLAYFREAGDALVSASEHARILGALELGDVNGAAALLDAHWRSGVAPLKKWLLRKETDNDSDDTA